jgi:hypothetical protein
MLHAGKFHGAFLSWIEGWFYRQPGLIWWVSWASRLPPALESSQAVASALLSAVGIGGWEWCDNSWLVRLNWNLTVWIRIRPFELKTSRFYRYGSKNSEKILKIANFISCKYPHGLSSFHTHSDEDINTSATIISSVEIVGSITWSRAQQLNH